jgi:serine/threonine-protein kinase
MPLLLLSILFVSGNQGICEAAKDQANPQTSASIVSEMIFIPAGRFSMGTTEDQRLPLITKYGLHPGLFAIQASKEVDVPAFFIEKHEVTCRQYKTFVEQSGHRVPIDWFEKGYSKESDDLPMTGIDYEDAQAYAAWVGRRLPTEIEWEKAARGVDGRLWPWGNDWKAAACGMDDLSRPVMKTFPDPVLFHPEDKSPYGVMDMAGNVSEWVRTDLPQKFGYCGGFRGGSYAFSQPFQFLVTSRNAQPKGNGGIGYLGFRCALDGNLKPEEACPVLSQTPTTQIPSLEGKPTPSKPPDPSRYCSTKIQILPIHDLDPTRQNYKNTMVCCHLPAADDPLPAGGPFVPWKVELRIPYLPSDRPALFFENHWGTEMQHLEFSQDHTEALFESNIPGFMDAKIRLEAGLDYLDIAYDVTNLSSEFVSSTVEMCMSLLNAPSFRDHDGERTFMLTDHGFKKRNEVPNVPFERLWCQDFTVNELTRTSVIAPLMQGNLIATLARDRGWIIAPTSLSGSACRLFNNWEYSCLHAVPYSAAQPGERVQVKQRLYFLRGGLNALVARYEKDRA